MQTSAAGELNIDWHELRPELDELLDELGAGERDAVVLRFLQGRRFSEIGNAFRISEDAARMRVERALEKLRQLLEKRGIRSTSAALTMALTTQASVAAPAGLAASVTSAALAGSMAVAAIGASGGLTALFDFMNAAKAVTTLVILAGIGTVGVVVFHARAAKEARTALTSSLQQQEILRLRLKAVETKIAGDAKDKVADLPAPTPVSDRSSTPARSHAQNAASATSAQAAALEAAKAKLAQIPNLARNGRIQDVEGIDEATVSAFRAWMKNDPPAVFAWLGSIPSERNQRMHTIEAVIAIELANDPEVAFLLADFHRKEFARIGRLRDVVAVWASIDPVAVARAVHSTDVSEPDRSVLIKVIERQSRPR